MEGTKFDVVSLCFQGMNKLFRLVLWSRFRVTLWISQKLHSVHVLLKLMGILIPKIIFQDVEVITREVESTRRLRPHRARDPSTGDFVKRVFCLRMDYYIITLVERPIARTDEPETETTQGKMDVDLKKTRSGCIYGHNHG
ncbi:uncharacterized protein LOC124159384 [Ischnura elegans]|uniref:uncharacterized protein LOC124159384 n=1 Tax=Ischnura elegans TaxID=197161 RepID=UPI001ED87AF5|nr:uncharacterized protein LOC124159384 [Ischnura elegans]